MRKQEHGFTLIELVIVLVILGILAAVAVPQFVNTTNTARNASASGGKATVASGIATYTARNFAAPTGTQLNSEITGTRCTAGTFIHILSQGSEGVKVQVLQAGGASPTGCATAVVGVGTTKYTTAI